MPAGRLSVYAGNDEQQKRLHLLRSSSAGAALLSWLIYFYCAFAFADLLESTYMTAIRITRPISRDRNTFLVSPATM